MAITQAHGYDGVVDFAGVGGIVALTRWEVTGTTDVVRSAYLTTTAGQKNKAAFGGYVEYSGSFEGYADVASTVDFDGLTGNNITVTFTEGTGTTHVAAIILSELRVSNPVDGVVELSGAFDVDGDFP